MKRCDLLNQYQFHPEILALREKESIKEVVFDKSAIQFKSSERKGNSSLRIKRFWMTDFPLICYANPVEEQDVEDEFDEENFED